MESKSTEFKAPSPKLLTFETPQKKGKMEAVANLSDKAKEIMLKIRMNKNKHSDEWVSDKNKSDAERKVDRILEAPSMKEKFSELLEKGDIKL